MLSYKIRGLRSGPRSGFYIGHRVTDHPTIREVNVPTLGSLEEHSGGWFAPAGAVIDVAAENYIIECYSGLGPQRFLQFIVDAVQIGFTHKAQPDASLIGNNDSEEAAVFYLVQNLGNAWQQFELIPMPYISS